MASDEVKWEKYDLQMTESYLRYFLNFKKILDIGAYKGKRVKLLRENGIDAIGVDLNQSNKYVIKADAKKLPFEKNSFECVILSHIIEHLTFSDLKKVISEAYRVLKNKGILFIATPVPKDVWDDCSHVRPYTFKAIKQLLEQPNYIGESWRFKVTRKEYKVRANEILRGIFYHIGLFGFYKRFIVPLQNILKLGLIEIVVLAEAKK